MENDIMGYLSVGLFLLVSLVYAFRFLRDRLSPVRTLKAVVIHKQTVETFSKYSGNGIHTKYAVTFQAGDKKLSFYVSEFSYKGYRVNETGILKYKGSRLIDFS